MTKRDYIREKAPLIASVEREGYNDYEVAEFAVKVAGAIWDATEGEESQDQSTLPTFTNEPCAGCKHFGVPVTQPPCALCTQSTPSKWENP
jgi:hypothetical protein